MNRERKIWLIIAGALIMFFIVYYLVMAVSAVNRTVNEFDNADNISNTLDLISEHFKRDERL